MKSSAESLRRLIAEMRAAYARGENVTDLARRISGEVTNSTEATLIAYDLQAGSYTKDARARPEVRARWCKQIGEIVQPHVDGGSTILEVGCGEATTLAGLLKSLNRRPRAAYGFDISWSRCAHGLTWLAENSARAELFVADLFEIPLEDESIDVVYTSHSLEPNGGREDAAIKELLRVARCAVVLVEPLYELAGPEAQDRMREHGYVRGLKQTAERLGARVTEYRLLEFSINALNPTGVLRIEKSSTGSSSRDGAQWRCPLTHTRLARSDMGFHSIESGFVYPVLFGIPLLRAEHAIVASCFEDLALRRR